MFGPHAQWIRQGSWGRGARPGCPDVVRVPSRMAPGLFLSWDTQDGWCSLTVASWPWGPVSSVRKWTRIEAGVGSLGGSKGIRG